MLSGDSDLSDLVGLRERDAGLDHLAPGGGQTAVEVDGAAGILEHDHGKALAPAVERPGGGAELGGLRRGDILVRLGKHEVGGVEDLMFALNASKPGETVTAVVLREGKELPLKVTFQESKRH